MIGIVDSSNIKTKEQQDEENIKERFKAWSCCMNTSKDSKGCHKEKINKHKWNLDHY